MTSEPLVPSSIAPASSAASGQGDLVAAASSGPDLVEMIAAETSVPGRTESIAAATSASGRSDSIAAPAAALGGPLAFVGVCVDDQHPSLAGRVLVCFPDEGGERALWLATLAHLPVRRDDRVLLVRPGNWPEPLVVGVIDGLRARTAATHPAAALTLMNDESLEIRDSEGAPLLAIMPTPAGPVLRLARADQRLEISGRLVFAADAIDFIARGEVSLAAGGDVVVTGEEIKLN